MLPVVQRELRVASRRTDIYRWRVIMGLLGACAITLLLISGKLSLRIQYSSGHFVFAFLLNVAILVCMLEAVRKMADAISGEKREGTLGLLFLTDLKGYDVILGKFVAHSIRSFHVLLAFMPVLAVTLLLGGITLGQFGRGAVILINTLFVSLSIALFVSTLTRNRSGTSTLAVLGFLMAAPILAGLFLDFAHPGETALFIKMLSPLEALWMNNGMVAVLHQSAFWGAVLVLHLFGWSALLLSSMLVGQTWQDRPLRRNETARQRDLGAMEKQKAIRGKLLDQNPAIWLFYKPRDHHFFKMFFYPMFVLVVLTGLAFDSHSDFLFLIFTGFVFKIFLASQSSAHFAAIRASGEIELLLSTPLTIQRIFSGQWAALRRMFGLAVLLLLAWPCVWMVGRGYNASSPYQGLSVWDLLFVLNLGCACFAIPLFGRWMGLTQRSANAAFFKTVLFTVLLPSLFFCIPTALWLAVAGCLAQSRARIVLARFGSENSFDNPRHSNSSPLSSTLPPVIRKQ